MARYIIEAQETNRIRLLVLANSPEEALNGNFEELETLFSLGSEFHNVEWVADPETNEFLAVAK